MVVLIVLNVHCCPYQSVLSDFSKETGMLIPSDIFLAVRKSDNRIAGIIDLRHHINHPILGTWGVPLWVEKEINKKFI